MAGTSDINYYKKSVVRSVKFWDLIDATVVDDYVQIKSGGYISFGLSNQIANGLKASKYRRVHLEIEVNPSVNFNYINLVELRLVGNYVDNDGNTYPTWISLNVTKRKSSIVQGILTMNRVIEMEDYDFELAFVYIVNHTNQVITVRNCKMLRSQDISSSQVGESIGWGITLDKVSAYLDGCELYYSGIETPDKLWWMEDSEGNFSGINVNNERIVKFERVNEILLD